MRFVFHLNTLQDATPDVRTANAVKRLSLRARRENWIMWRSASKFYFNLQFPWWMKFNYSEWFVVGETARERFPFVDGKFILNDNHLKCVKTQQRGDMFTQLNVIGVSWSAPIKTEIDGKSIKLNSIGFWHVLVGCSDSLLACGKQTLNWRL